MMEAAGPMPSSDISTRALPTLHEFFSPGGILARSPLPYEYRPGQLEMAKAVERALAERRHLIVEAGTGTGKTLAYLLPALRTGQRVIISTGTKALQDQLYFRDVPFLESLLGELRVCYMKGRANYLCRHKLVTLRSQNVTCSGDFSALKLACSCIKTSWANSSAAGGSARKWRAMLNTMDWCRRTISAKSTGTASAASAASAGTGSAIATLSDRLTLHIRGEVV